MKEKDPRYTFPVTVSAHLILENTKRQILMGKRPLSWEWAPGRWGLIGGKIYKQESFEDTIKRKTLQELGFPLAPEGLYQIRQLIISDKQAYMYFFAARYNGQKISGELAEYKWLGQSDFEAMPVSEFGEYFYKNMLGEYLSTSPELLPISKVQTLNYIELEETPAYKQWFEGIVNKDFDPEKVADFKRWKKAKLK